MTRTTSEIFAALRREMSEAHELVRAIRAGEVQRTLGRLPAATPETREAIEALSTAIVNKILHAPITKLRESSRAGSSRSWLELVHELFGLGRK